MLQDSKSLSLQHTGGGPLCSPDPSSSSPCARPSEPFCRLCVFPPCTPHSRGLRNQDGLPIGRMTLWRYKLQGGAVWGYGLGWHLLPELLVLGPVIRSSSRTKWGDGTLGSKRLGQTRLCPPQVAYFQSALDKLNEAIKLAKVKLNE